MNQAIRGLTFFLVFGAATARAQFPAGAPVYSPDSQISPAGDSSIPPNGNDTSADSSSRFWIQKSFLLDWLNKSPTPIPLVTLGSLRDSLPGAIGQPHTTVLAGDSSRSTGPHMGGQLSAGYWLDDDRTYGVEASYLFLASRSSTQTIGTSGLPGSPNLAAPYFDVTGTGTFTGVPGQSVYVLPGPLPGPNGTAVPGFAGLFSYAVKNSLQGDDANFSRNLIQGGGLRFDILAGVRWFQMNEDLELAIQTTGVPGSANAGQFFNASDSFRARNNFYGGQLGGRVQYQSGAWTLASTSKIALGSMNESVDVFGAARTSSGNLFFQTGGIDTQPFPGGVFAQPSNIGNHGRSRFAAVIDETLTVSYQPKRWLRLFGGYNFMFASAVARPGAQLNSNINTTQTGLAAISRAAGMGPAVIGPPEPSFTFHDSSFWAQGVSCGVEVRY